MTLIRKHERVDGKFDVEPRDGQKVIAITPSCAEEVLWGSVGDMVECCGDGSLLLKAAITAYIDPSEEVAPVEVRRVKQDPPGTVRSVGDPDFFLTTVDEYLPQVANLLNLRVRE